MIKIEKDKYGKTPNVWITSDTHYSHSNICRGTTNWRMTDGSIPVEQTRDFSTLEKMNDIIVNNINEVVMQDDILIHLGDWSFGGFEKIKEFRDRIVCQNIHLVLGNHDQHIERNKEGIQSIFTTVSYYNTLIIDVKTFRLMHYPISSWDGLSKGVMHLHGHVHLPPSKRFGNGKRMDIGMDGHPEFRPYNVMKECYNLLKDRVINSEISGDHHIDEIVNIK